LIAVDSSSWIAYLAGDRGGDVEAVEASLAASQVCLPLVVLTEILSDSKLPEQVLSLFRQLPLLLPSEGYWERAGRLRAQILSHRRKAPLADTLIAQSCLDNDVPLITRDSDFQPFARIGGLKLFQKTTPSRWLGTA
jgi:predicted nucleic acid-binding protein